MLNLAGAVNETRTGLCEQAGTTTGRTGNSDKNPAMHHSQHSPSQSAQALQYSKRNHEDLYHQLNSILEFIVYSYPYKLIGEHLLSLDFKL